MVAFRVASRVARRVASRVAQAIRFTATGPDFSGSVVAHEWTPSNPSFQNDSVGSLNLTLYGAPTLGSGTGPGGVDVINFSGGNHLRQTAVSAFAISDGFALECYVKISSDPPSQNGGFIISQQDNSGNLNFQLFFRKTDGKFAFRMFNTSNDDIEITGGLRVVDQWHHVIAMYKNGFLQLWIDGSLVAIAEWTLGTFQTTSGFFALGSLPSAPHLGYDLIGAGYGFRIYI